MKLHKSLRCLRIISGLKARSEQTKRERREDEKLQSDEPCARVSSMYIYIYIKLSKRELRMYSPCARARESYIYKSRPRRNPLHFPSTNYPRSFFSGPYKSLSFSRATNPTCAHNSHLVIHCSGEIAVKIRSSSSSSSSRLERPPAPQRVISREMLLYTHLPYLQPGILREGTGHAPGLRSRAKPVPQ